jgi:hypothetical protein
VLRELEHSFFLMRDRSERLLTRGRGQETLVRDQG